MIKKLSDGIKTFMIPFIPAILGVCVLIWGLSYSPRHKADVIYVQETTTESGIKCVIASKGELISLSCDFNDYE